MTINPRRQFLNFVQKQIPPVSVTEQQALDAGDTSFEEGMYNGKIDWEGLHAVQKSELTAAEKSFLENETETLCAMIDPYETTQNKDLSPEVWDYIKKKKFLGMLIPEDEGGLGFGTYARSRIVEKIASRSEAAGVTVMVPNSLGPGELLHKYGTQTQKDKYLEGLADGTYVPCFALTEQNAGSDATSIQAEGIVEKRVGENGKEEVGIRLNFDKRYITLAPVSNLIGLAFQLRDPDNLLGKGENVGITCALMERGTEGLDLDKRYNPMNVPFMNGGPVGKDVWITPDQIIGGTEQAGNGWKMLVECLSEGRANSLPTLGIAAAKKMAKVAGSYITVRQQFGASLSIQHGVQEKLAEIAGLSYLGDAARSLTLKIIDDGKTPTVPGAILKYHLTENMRVTVNNAMDILAGKAIMLGPNNLVVDTYNSVPIGITVEGANILTRNMLVFGQGSYRLHPDLQKLKEHSEKEEALALVGRGAKAFVGDPIYKTARLYWNATSGGTPGGHPEGSPLKEYYTKINRLASIFASVTSTHATYLGGDIKRLENVSAKMGDVLSHIYLSSSVLWHFEERGRPEGELKLAKWALETELHKAESAMAQALRSDNTPFTSKLNPGSWARPIHRSFLNKPVHHGPSDQLSRDVAKIITTDNPTRDALLETIYNPSTEGTTSDPLAKMEKAFQLACQTKALDKKIRGADKAAGLGNDTPLYLRAKYALEAEAITQGEYDQLVSAQVARDDINRVDAFTVRDFPEYK